MSRIRRGWALTKKSWALLNGHRELIRFPLYGAVATVLLLVPVPGQSLGGVAAAATIALVMGAQASIARFLAVTDMTTVVVTSTITSYASETLFMGGLAWFTHRRLWAVVAIFGGDQDPVSDYQHLLLGEVHGERAQPFRPFPWASWTVTSFVIRSFRLVVGRRRLISSPTRPSASARPSGEPRLM